MNVEIPDALKAEVPPTMWGRVLAATPVVLAVVATLLAGLASNEMSTAQYGRSLAAQQQSKAGDQWGYFQAKRLRGTGLKTAGDMLQVTAEVGRFDPATLKSSFAGLARALSRCDECAQRLSIALNSAGPTDQATATSLAGQLGAFLNAAPVRTAEVTRLAADLAALLSAADASSALGILCGGDLPAHDAGPKPDAGLAAALEGLQDELSEAQMERLLARVSDSQLEEALQAAWERVRAFDKQLAPVNDLSDRFGDLLDRQVALAQGPLTIARLMATIPHEAGPGLRQAAEALASACSAAHAETLQLVRDFTAVQFAYSARRYDAEAALNQNIANLYELQVRKNNISADRHHTRGQRFFFGMLVAQAGVIIATLAMAARRRNLLWSLAAGAGLAAVSFTVYVFLAV